MRKYNLFLWVATLWILGMLLACKRNLPAEDLPTPTQIVQLIPLSTPITIPDLLMVTSRPADGMQMVYVPGGSFNMGGSEDEIAAALVLCQRYYSPCNRWYYGREGPQHSVSLDGFWIDQTEVTNAQYRQCVDVGICTQSSWCKKGEPTYDDPEKIDHPVVCVSWEDARTYCQWVGGRLPTEAEWEYAYRGESGLVFPWGDEFDGSQLNYCDANCSQSHADPGFDDSYTQTAPVGHYPVDATWSGVNDMGGNVSEWVADWAGTYMPEAVSNPIGPDFGSEKMLKGGSWFTHPAACRGAARPSVSPDTRFDYLGFRCVVPEIREMEGDKDMGLKSLEIPSGNPPVIDGTMAPGEWDDASIERFGDGSELLLMFAGDSLYLGIKASTPGMIVGNVYVQSEDQIKILHASAALGTAVYQKDGVQWQRVRNFSWQCRQVGEAAKEERNAYLEQEGWVAANSRIGTPNELEFRIKMVDPKSRLAVNFMRTSNPNEKIPWPVVLNDDCIKPTPGGLPEILYFSPDDWAVLNWAF